MTRSKQDTGVTNLCSLPRLLSDVPHVIVVHTNLSSSLTTRDTDPVIFMLMSCRRLGSSSCLHDERRLWCGQQTLGMMVGFSCLVGWNVSSVCTTTSVTPKGTTCTCQCDGGQTRSLTCSQHQTPFILVVREVLLTRPRRLPPIFTILSASASLLFSRRTHFDLTTTVLYLLCLTIATRNLFSCIHWDNPHHEPAAVQKYPAPPFTCENISAAQPGQLWHRCASPC